MITHPNTLGDANNHQTKPKSTPVTEGHRARESVMARRGTQPAKKQLPASTVTAASNSRGSQLGAERDALICVTAKVGDAPGKA